MNALLRHHGGPCLLPNRFLRGHTQWPKISMLRTRPVASRWHAAKASVTAPPAELKVAGSEGGAAHLALNVAPARSAKGLVHRYLMYVRANARQGTSSTLTRGEVRGGGRKPYRQKGTGSARQGSIRTPLKVHGGVVFGPKPRNWSIKMNRKERRLAYATALNSAKDNITVVPDFQAEMEPKAKAMTTAFKDWGLDLDRHTLLITAEQSQPLLLAGRNIAKLSLNSAHGLRIYDLLRADQIAIEKSALEHINSFFGPKADAAEVPSFASTPASGVPDAPTKDADAAPESG